MKDKVIERIAKKLIMALSSKGGTGKSHAIRCLIDWARFHGLVVAAYDADASVSSLSLALGTRDSRDNLLAVQDPLVGVMVYNMRDPAHRDTILNSLDTTADLVCHDMPGGSLLSLASIFADGSSPSLDGLSETAVSEGFEVVVLHLVTPNLATIHSVREHMRWLGPDVRHVAILNHAFGDDEDFMPWVESKTRKAFLAAGGLEIRMPRLKAADLRAVDSLRLSIFEAADDKRISLAHRARIRPFVKSLETEFKKLSEWI